MSAEAGRWRMSRAEIARLAVISASAGAMGLAAAIATRPDWAPYFLMGIGALLLAVVTAIDARRVMYLLILLMPIETIGPLSLIPSKLAKLGIMAVLLLFELGRRAIRHDLSWKRTPYDLFILIYLVSGTLATALSILPTQSAQAVIQSALIFGFFGLITQRVNSSKRVQWLIRAMLVVAVMVAAYGIVQKVLGTGVLGSEYITQKIGNFYAVMGKRLFSVMNNPNALGGYMGTMLPVAMAYLALGKMRPRRRWALAGACLLMLLNIVWTASRGAIAGTGVAFIVLVLLLRRNRLPVILLGMTFAGFLAVFVAVNLRAVQGYLRVFSSLDVTLAGRPEIWSTALRIALDHLPFGIGFYTWGAIYPTYGLNLWKTVDDAHNLALNMFMELGIPGALLFIGFIIAFFTSSIRLIRRTRFNPTWYPFAVAVFCAGLSRLVHETVEADTLIGVSSVVQVFWVLLALQTVVARIVAREASRQREVPGGE